MAIPIYIVRPYCVIEEGRAVGEVMPVAVVCLTSGTNLENPNETRKRLH